MATKRFVYLTFLDAVELHFELMRQLGEKRIGIFDKALVQSALARPKHAATYENADVIRQAATLCFGLVKNHPWFGGNKRTASHLTEIFLFLNGYRVIYDLSEIVELVLNIEADTWKVDDIENWFRERTSRF